MIEQMYMSLRVLGRSDGKYKGLNFHRQSVVTGYIFLIVAN